MQHNVCIEDLNYNIVNLLLALQTKEDILQICKCILAEAIQSFFL